MCKTGCLEIRQSLHQNVAVLMPRAVFYFWAFLGPPDAQPKTSEVHRMDTVENLAIRGLSRSPTYSTKFVVKTFVVRENNPIDRPANVRLKAGGSEDATRIARAIYDTLDPDKEHFAVLALNQKNRLIGYKHVSTGTLISSLVHPREVFTAAVELRAAALIFVHNHASGDPLPSQEDFEITRRLKSCGEILGFRILDHIILGCDHFYSFSDRGAL